MSKTNNDAPLDPFGILNKLVEQFKLPGVDTESIIANRRKDVQALMEVNSAVLESFQQLAKKQAEIYRQAMESAQEGLQALTKGGAAPTPATVSELALKAHEKAVAQMNELAQMAQKAQSDAMAHITQRANESMEEIKKLLQPKS